MTIELTAPALRAIFPRAPQTVLDAFLEKQSELTKVGVNHTRPRLAHFFANIEHECGGFTIKNLTENTNYTAERMAAVWPNRFASADAVRAKYGTAAGWQLRALDDIYGNRMGNRPGTRDGSTYIGRAGPQWTGRDGYAECEKRTGLPAISNPTAIAAHGVQPEVCAAFWDWKNLNRYADTGNFTGGVKVWNGGTNGLADRLALLNGNDPIIAKLANVEILLPVLKTLPGAPPTATPPADVIAEATKGERRTVAGAVAGGVAAGGHEVAKGTTGIAPVPVLPSVAAYAALGVFVTVALVATVLLARKKAAVVANWF